MLFVVGMAIAAFDGIQRPPLDSLEPRLVERDELAAASALGSLRMNVGMIAGPAVGGVLIATVGLPATYAVDLATFAALDRACSRSCAPFRRRPGAERPSIRGVVDGIRYAKSRQELIGTYGVDFIAMFFGMPMALFPAYAERVRRGRRSSAPLRGAGDRVARGRADERLDVRTSTGTDSR